MKKQYGIKKRESFEFIDKLISSIRNDRGRSNRFGNGNIDKEGGVQGASSTSEQIPEQQQSADKERSEGDSSESGVSKDDIKFSRTINDGSFSLPKTDNNGKELSPQVQKWARNSKDRNSDGELLELYHTMTDLAAELFYEFKSQEIPGSKFRGQNVIYTTSSKDVSSSYARNRNDIETVTKEGKYTNTTEKYWQFPLYMNSVNPLVFEGNYYRTIFEEEFDYIKVIGYTSTGNPKVWNLLCGWRYVE